MGHILVQHQIQSANGLAADNVTNTFHFQTPGAPTVADANQAITKVKAFFDTVYSGNPAGVGVGTLVSALMLNTGRLCKAYDMDEPPPRVPLATDTSTMIGTGVAAVPREVAVVLSFRSLIASGVPAARRKGRVFIGPFASGTGVNPTQFLTVTSSDVRPTLVARQILSRAAVQLANHTAGGALWSTYSTVDDFLSPVLSGWIDDACDTQRRRGSKPTTRENWTGAV